MNGKIAAACAATATAVFGSAALAAPAHAADWEQACFTTSTGFPWMKLGVQLHVYTGSGWILAAQSESDVNGCAAFDLTGDYAVLPSHIVAYEAVSDGNGGVAYEWSGISANAPAEHRAVNLGTYTVACTPGTLPCP